MKYEKWVEVLINQKVGAFSLWDKGTRFWKLTFENRVPIATVLNKELKAPGFEKPSRVFENRVPIAQELHKELKAPVFEKWVFQNRVPLATALHKKLKAPGFFYVLLHPWV